MEKIYISYGTKLNDAFLDANGIHLLEEFAVIPIDSMEVFTAKCFIRCFAKRIKSINKNRSSYGLKHDAERWGKEMMSLGLDTLSYVSNGAFIKAMISEGFIPVFIDPLLSLNCFFRASWRR